MTLQLAPKITVVGLDAVIEANGDGLKAKVKFIALGDGSGAGYVPSGSETALKRERERIPINFSMKDGPGAFRVRGVSDPLPGVAQEYWIREIGIILDDGTLLAVWSDQFKPLTGRGYGAELELDFKLVLNALPDGSIEIVVTPGGDNVLTALASHTAALAALTDQQMSQRIALEKMKENS